MQSEVVVRVGFSSVWWLSLEPNERGWISIVRRPSLFRIYVLTLPFMQAIKCFPLQDLRTSLTCPLSLAPTIDVLMTAAETERERESGRIRWQLA